MTKKQLYEKWLLNEIDEKIKYSLKKEREKAEKLVEAVSEYLDKVEYWNNNCGYGITIPPIELYQKAIEAIAEYKK